jgi:hypothetical protein
LILRSSFFGRLVWVRRMRAFQLLPIWKSAPLDHANWAVGSWLFQTVTGLQYEVNQGIFWASAR